MNGGGCGKIIFGIRHNSTDYWTVNMRKFKCKEKQDIVHRDSKMNELFCRAERWKYE